jgi:hypothetical protein
MAYSAIHALKHSKVKENFTNARIHVQNASLKNAIKTKKWTFAAENAE